jgi:hypothetical protein
LTFVHPPFQFLQTPDPAYEIDPVVRAKDRKFYRVGAAEPMSARLEMLVDWLSTGVIRHTMSIGAAV